MSFALKNSEHGFVIDKAGTLLWKEGGSRKATAIEVLLWGKLKEAEAMLFDVMTSKKKKTK
jgi:hypothetical protein